MTHFRPERPTVVVAIPARDEQEHIAACLLALAEQNQPPDEVVLLLNNCCDQTAMIASGASAHLPFGLDVISRDLPPLMANAGHARRLAMQFAAQRAGANGVLLTTDADTVVPPDWVSRNLAALSLGADLVCGRVELDPADAALIPAHLHADDALECELTTLIDEIAHTLDPNPTDPWPRHTEAAGASLAVTVPAFTQVGGIPAVASGEDRAFVAALARMDAAIRHDPSIVVTVSGRHHGRAPGGMADTIRRRMQQQDEYTDQSLEPGTDAYRRLDFRRRVRLAWRHGSASVTSPQDLAVDLGIPSAILRRMLRTCHFGAAWAEAEARSPFLVRRRVRFSDLPRQIAHARRLLERQCDAEIQSTDEISSR